MKLEDLHSKLAEWKGAVLRELQRNGCVNTLVVEPMTPPDPPWTEKNWGEYADILGVQEPGLIARHTEQWGVGRRRQYFAELGCYSDQDFFIDPDLGVATGEAKPQHVKPQEIRGLLKEGNVVAVYQHRHRSQPADERARAVAEAVHRHQPSIDCLGLIWADQNAAILFFSMQSNRLDDIAACLEGRSRLGSLSRFPPDRRLLTRVRMWNYKSIAACDVALRQIAFLVGPNGSGKSNFLDALRFTADALSSNLDHALRIRGGIGLVRTLGRGTEPFGIRLHLELPAYRGWYALTIAAKGEFGFEICREECHLVERRSNRKHCFRVERGKVVDASVSIAPKAEADRLYLVTVSGLKAFRSAFDALAGMRSSNPIPDRIRPIKPPASARSLHRDASNLASVLGGLEKRAPGFKTRIDQYLGSIVPGIAKTSRWPKDTDETIAFSQDAGDDRDRLPASSMSDGTLRTLGILLALFQGAAAGESERQLVGIEEPEAALHPAAAEALMDAIREAALHVQVLVTSHSAELLDGVPVDSIIAVAADRGTTLLGPVDNIARSALRDRLFTAGELLRMDQLGAAKPESQRPASLDLFEIES